MLYIFDKDGTLVGKGAWPASGERAEQPLLPGVERRLANLRKDGHRLAIASNQGGVAWGFITLADADFLVKACADKIGADAYAFCPHDDRKGTRCECRKPRPGMLLQIMAQLDAAPDDVVMVGDDDVDRQAADAAGVRFVLAEEFFKWR
jgi:D-glycero-D-manno-heptose 1,7-bisphosphate phosphatase